jgi:hypothetical protein
MVDKELGLVKPICPLENEGLEGTKIQDGPLLLAIFPIKVIKGMGNQLFNGPEHYKTIYCRDFANFADNIFRMPSCWLAQPLLPVNRGHLTLVAGASSALPQYRTVTLIRL